MIELVSRIFSFTWIDMLLGAGTGIVGLLASWASTNNIQSLRKEKKLWVIQWASVPMLDFGLVHWLVKLIRLIPFLPGIGLIAAGAVVMSLFFNVSFGLGMLGAYAIVALICSPLGLHKLLVKNRITRDKEAARCLANLNSSIEATKKLHAVTKDRDPLMRLAAVEGWKYYGDSAALAELNTLQNDVDARVSAEAKAAFEAIDIALHGNINWVESSMKLLAASHQNSLVERKKSRSRDNWAHSRLVDLEDKMDQAALASLRWKLAGSAILCKVCLARAEQTQYSVWTWVRCRVCHETQYLETGIETVIGEIISDVDWKLIGSELHLGLWSPLGRVARFADVDRLDIFGGIDMNYDWAVNAFVEKVLAHGQVRPLKVRLLDSPTLSTNSMQLLKTISTDIESEE